MKNLHQSSTLSKTFTGDKSGPMVTSTMNFFTKEAKQHNFKASNIL